MSKFGIVQRTDKGVKAVVTQDITLKRGQTIFFNDYEESINNLVKYNVITSEAAAEQIEKTRKLDREYKRETLYSLRAGKLPEEKEGEKL